MLYIVAAVFTLWSGFRPYDRFTWFFELSLGFAGVAVLTATYRRFRFSYLAYLLVAAHFAILAIGAKYTYALMPLFDWLKEALELSRNHYDRVGHFAQGFFPVIILREILLRCTPLRRGKMLAFLCVCVCLGLSAFYELIEWWVVILFYPDEGPSWLGMQGDPWDAQWDMTMCTCGAILSLILFSRMHDRSMLHSPTDSGSAPAESLVPSRPQG
jgi:putative membrane protein